MPLRDFVEALGDRGFAIVLLVLAAPNSLPIPSPPGLSTVFGVPLAFFSVQMMLGRPRPWLPERLMRRTVGRAEFRLVVAKYPCPGSSGWSAGAARAAGRSRGRWPSASWAASICCCRSSWRCRSRRQLPAGTGDDGDVPRPPRGRPHGRHRARHRPGGRRRRRHDRVRSTSWWSCSSATSCSAGPAGLSLQGAGTGSGDLVGGAGLGLLRGGVGRRHRPGGKRPAPDG